MSWTTSSDGSTTPTSAVDGVVNSVTDAAAGQDQRGLIRQPPSESKALSAVHPSDGAPQEIPPLNHCWPDAL